MTITDQAGGPASDRAGLRVTYGGRVHPAEEIARARRTSCSAPTRRRVRVVSPARHRLSVAAVRARDRGGRGARRRGVGGRHGRAAADAGAPGPGLGVRTPAQPAAGGGG
ncbi:hypothetical protein V2I01_18675 [Micromonospora sp. BRA006-A]|nr:hypothetical protein [Micromonospora sp. BRA006-A]